MVTDAEGANPGQCRKSNEIQLTWGNVSLRLHMHLSEEGFIVLNSWQKMRSNHSKFGQHSSAFVQTASRKPGAED